MKVGDRVRHITRLEIVGTIVKIDRRNHGTLVNLSDSQGVRFRWFRLRDLEAQVKFKDVFDDDSAVSEREPTGLTVNASGVFEKMDNITLHLLAMENTITAIYFKTKLFCILFTIFNLIAVALISLAMG